MRTFISGPPVTSSSEQWEQAYRRFETRDKEIRKFVRRLTEVGAQQWSPSARIAELFCGRGSGLLALAQLGFVDLEGIDLSPTLIASYEGPGNTLVGDCRELPWMSGTKDVLIVQGGLHHLLNLQSDLDKVLAEARRVLSPGGRFVAIEPWLTPFLQGVHLASFSKLRLISGTLDAFATMVEHERDTYERWLNAPDLVISLFARYFRIEQKSISWGKLRIVGVNDLP